MKTQLLITPFLVLLIMGCSSSKEIAATEVENPIIETVVAEEITEEITEEKIVSQEINKIDDILVSGITVPIGAQC